MTSRTGSCDLNCLCVLIVMEERTSFKLFRLFRHLILFFPRRLMMELFLFYTLIWSSSSFIPTFGRSNVKRSSSAFYRGKKRKNKAGYTAVRCVGIPVLALSFVAPPSSLSSLPLHIFPSLTFAISNPWQSRKAKKRGLHIRTKWVTDGRTDQRTNGRTDERTDGRTHPLIEMRGRI